MKRFINDFSGWIFGLSILGLVAALIMLWANGVVWYQNESNWNVCSSEFERYCVQPKPPIVDGDIVKKTIGGSIGGVILALLMSAVSPAPLITLPGRLKDLDKEAGTSAGGYLFRLDSHQGLVFRTHSTHARFARPGETVTVVYSEWDQNDEVIDAHEFRLGSDFPHL